ncbi:MAG: cation diffusion facilitator family transporter [Acidiferrobacterales bacterium]
MTESPAKSIEEMQRDADQHRYRSTVRVTLVGSALDLMLGIAKVVVGFASQSQALIADGIHSFSDLLTDGLVLYAVSHANQAADEEHPYGHRRIETAATVGLGAILIAVAIGIAFDAGLRLFEPERLLKPGMIALVVAAISIVSKEAIYHYTMRTAREVRSDLLRANAWHSRTDAISSIIVFIGVAGTMAGLNYLDALGAIGVALMIVKIGWDLMWRSLRELVDTGLEPNRIAAIRESIMSVDGVSALHLLRTRRMGGDALADVHLQVNPVVSVSEGHHISEAVRTTLIRDIDEISDVTVHIDTENDQAAKRSHELPLRSEAIRNALDCFRDIDSVDDIEQIGLHYLDGKIQLELLLPLERAHDTVAARALAQQFQDAIRDSEIFSNVEIRFG